MKANPVEPGIVAVERAPGLGEELVCDRVFGGHCVMLLLRAVHGAASSGCRARGRQPAAGWWLVAGHLRIQGSGRVAVLQARQTSVPTQRSRCDECVRPTEMRTTFR